MKSLQGAGGICGMVALSPSVGVYPGSGRFTSHAPIRVVQPNTHPNHSLDLVTVDNVFLQEEGQQRKRQRQAAIPPVAMSFEVLNGKRIEPLCFGTHRYKKTLLPDGSLAKLLR